MTQILLTHIEPGLIGCCTHFCKCNPLALNRLYAKAGVDDCLVNIKIFAIDSTYATAKNPCDTARAIPIKFGRKKR